MRIKRFNELHTGVESGPEDANFQHQQAGGELKRSPQVSFNKVDINNDVLHISDLLEGDVIIYQGSKAMVRVPGEFVVKCQSTDTGKEFLINQGQLEQYGLKVIARRYH